MSRAPALEAHDRLLASAVAHTGGIVVKTTGDGLLAVFDAVDAAIGAALEGQRALAAHAWGATGPLRTRGLLPDVLVYDPSDPGGYPNGRRLTDDVVDLMIAMVTMGRVATDGVDPHTDLLDEFPYLGAPHAVRV